MNQGAELHDIRVVDASRLGPGPYATSLLVQLGAEVVKIEEPGRGDYLRAEPPFVEGVGHFFAVLNRGKRSVVADLKTSEGRRAVLEFAAQSHVMVESFRPGVADRLGIGYEDVLAVNSRIVYCSVNGWGEPGEAAGHDLSYLAETGYLASNARATGSAPRPQATLLADFAAGQAAALRITAALVAGGPRRLNVPIAQAALALDPIGVAEHLSGLSGGRSMTGGRSRYAVYRCRDEAYLAVAALEDKFWARFLEVAGVDSGVSEEDSGARIAEAIEQRTGEEWRAALADADACVAVVDDLATAVPRLLDRFPGWWIRDHSGTPVGVALPGSPGATLGPPPRLGDTDIGTSNLMTEGASSSGATPTSTAKEWRES